MTIQEMQNITNIHLNEYINRFMAKENCLENLSYTAVVVKLYEYISQKDNITKYKELFIGDNIYEILIGKYVKLNDVDKADVWHNTQKVIDKIMII